MNRHLRNLVTFCILFTIVLAPAAPSEPARTDLFVAGQGGFALYRIPGIIVTRAGTLLAYCEARTGGGDWSDTRIVLRRSADGGRTWSMAREIFALPEPQAVNPLRLELRDELGHAQTNSRTYHNAVMIPDRIRGDVHAIFCVDYWRAFYSRSRDDGLTFDKPVEVTDVVARYRQKDWNWRVVGNGTGHGIQLDNGRLLVPFWLSTATQPRGHGHRPSHVGVLFSDDHGRSWEIGDWAARHAPPDLLTPSEACVVQLAGGSVMMNLRHETTNRLRAVSLSANGATGWSEARFDEGLFEPVCEASIIRVTRRPEHDRNRILFCNPDSRFSGGRNQRRNLTLKLSYDEGRTWPVQKVLEPGIAAYSDLAVANNGTIYCIFERGTTAGGNQFRTGALTLASFTLEWLESGAASGDKPR